MAAKRNGQQQQPEQVSPPSPKVFIHLEFKEPGSAVITASEITQGISPVMLWGVAEVLRQEGIKRMQAGEAQLQMRQQLTGGIGQPIPGIRRT